MKRNGQHIEGHIRKWLVPKEFVLLQYLVDRLFVLWENCGSRLMVRKKRKKEKGDAALNLYEGLVASVYHLWTIRPQPTCRALSHSLSVLSFLHTHSPLAVWYDRMVKRPHKETWFYMEQIFQWPSRIPQPRVDSTRPECDAALSLVWRTFSHNRKKELKSANNPTKGQRSTRHTPSLSI